MSNSEAFDLIRRVSGVLSDAGLALDGEPDCSGNLVRCGTVKRPHGTDGAYAVHLDKTPLVWLCNWHDGGLPQTVYLYEKSQLDALTEAEREALRERIRQEMVGRTRCVEVKRGWKEHGNIWIVLVASSGLGKTPVMNAFFRPVEGMEIRRFREWKEAIDDFNRDWMDYTRAKKEERGLPPKKPRRTQYYLDDSTVEALTDALEQNPRGVMWRVDELSGLLSSFDKYSSGKEGGTRARLLFAYDCQSWKSNRRNEERNLHIPAACVSIFGGLQPGMMGCSFDGSDRDSGFLPRFMFIRAERERPSLWSEETLSPASHALLRGTAEHLPIPPAGAVGYGGWR